MDQNPATNPQRKKKAIAGIVAAVLMLALFGLGKIMKNEADKSGQILPELTNNSNVTAITAVYKNGEYTQSSGYLSPGGTEQIQVKLKLENDIIVDTAVEFKPTKSESVTFQEIFTQNYKQYVLGKNITEVILDKVSGSSLTPKGFNNALEKIKAQAKA